MVIGFRRTIGFTEAAGLLQELGICKALREGGRINGPNCYRFGHRDPDTGRWSWDVAELIQIARKRQSASILLINEVTERYGIEEIPFPTKDNMKQPPTFSGPIRTPSRADVEKLFRDEVRTLEALMKRRFPIDGLQEDRRTLGSLIIEFENHALFHKVEISEAWFVNNIRNTLNHPNLGSVSDDCLKRGLESVRALVRNLQALSGNK